LLCRVATKDWLVLEKDGPTSTSPSDPEGSSMQEHRLILHAAQGRTLGVGDLSWPPGCKTIRTNDPPNIPFDKSYIGSPMGAAKIMARVITVRWSA